MTYDIYQLPVFEADETDYLAAVRGVEQHALLPLMRQMREHVPVPGDDWVKVIAVDIAPGQDNHQGQCPHEHDEWTAIYYVDLGDPAVPVYVDNIGTVDEITPAPGTLIVMPPRIRHWVGPSRSETRRLSLAMLVEDPAIPSKFRV